MSDITMLRHADECPINGDPGDDRIENLEIVSRAGHIEMHRAELLAARLAA